MGTPFEDAGYTKDTKFKVIDDSDVDFKLGEIVWLEEDDGTTLPLFTNEEDTMGYMHFGGDSPDLEVYEEEPEQIQLTEEGYKNVTDGLNNPPPSNERLLEAAKRLREDRITNACVEVPTEDKEALTNTDLEPLSLAARIIVSQTNSYNGHNQLTVTYKPSLDELTGLMEDLDKYYTKINANWSVYTQIESDGSGSIHVRDYWGDGEAPVKSHKDKLLFSFGEK